MSSVDLSALYGGSGGTGLLYGQSGSSGAASLAALKSAERNRDREVARTEKQTDVARDIARFRTAVAKATDVKAALKDPAILKVLLTANGLGDQVDFPGLASRALASDPADRTSLVSRLADSRWRDVAKTYAFATKGLSVLQDPKVQQTLADGYAEITWRQSLDRTTPGLSSALTFRAKASTAKDAVTILGNSVLREVVTTALGIPKQLAFQELPAQERAITSRLDISRLQDPHFVDVLTQRYLLAKAQSGSPTSTGSLASLSVQLRSLSV